MEVQVNRDRDYINRSLYYLARLFSDQLSRGDGYDEVCKTVGISILDFPLFPEQPDHHSTFRFYDQIHQRELSDILEIHYLELTKFKRNQPQELRTRFERWLHILKFGELYRDEDTPIPDVLLQDEEVTMAIKAYRQVSASEEVREMLEFRMKAERDEATRLSRARKDGREEGREEGRLRGRLEAGRKMLAAGVDIQTVCGALEFTPEQLELAP